MLTPSLRVREDEDEDEAQTTATEPPNASIAPTGLIDTHPPDADADAGPEGALAHDPVAEAADPVSPPDTGPEARTFGEGDFDDNDPGDGDPEAEDDAPGVPDEADEAAPHAGPEDGYDDPASGDIAAFFSRNADAKPTAWEPDGDEEDAFAEGGEAPALDWRDVDEAEAYEVEAYEAHSPDARPAQDTGPDDRDRGLGGADFQAGTTMAEDNAFAIEDEAVLDEEALRDLVAEIVREELMGTLGERITRNVRKLVRREIHRALNAQDFD